MIKVIYNKVCGRCVQSEPLTSGMVGQPIHFEYSHDFDGLTLTAVFTNGKTTVDVLNPGNQCVIPHEVLDTVGTLVKVGIYATRGNELVIPTIYAHIGVVLKGADPSGDVSADPTLPVWAQIQGIIGNLNDLNTEAKNNLVAAINEAAQSGGGGSTVELDTTLTQSGKAADAKAVGDVTIRQAELGEDGVASFKNAAGIVLFTVDFSNLTPAVYGDMAISAEAVEIAEGGSGTFAVHLATAPTVNQPVYLAVSDNTRLSVSPSSLTFTPENYATPQTVTVTSAQDDDEDDDTITVTLTSRKVDAKQLLVSIVDDDKPVLVEDGLYCNLDFRNRVSDNGDGGDHSIVNSVDGTAYTVNNMLFDGQNDGFHAKGLFFRPPSAFSNYNKYNATTFGSVQLFSTDDFYGGKVPQDNSQDFHITIEVTGTLCQHLTESSNGTGEILTFSGQQPCKCGDWLLRGPAFYSYAQPPFYNSAGEKDDSMKSLAITTRNVIRNGEIVLLRSVLDFLEEHTFTVVIGPGTKRLYVDGEALCNAEGETVIVGADFQYYYAQYETNKWFFGSNGGRSDAYPQYWAHFRVYKRELNADEVLQNYKYDVSRRAVSTF